MKTTIRQKIVTIAFLVFIMGGALLCVLHPPKESSESERRKLAQFPDLIWERVLDTKFMKDFETYTLDQFPGRDLFRQIKAITHYNIFLQKDNNDIYLVGDSVSKLDYPLRKDSITNATSKFNHLVDKYFTGTDAKIYYSVIPDKNVFLAEANGYPSADPDALLTALHAGMQDYRYIDIFPYLTIDDYYRTDTHWRQESILDVADALAGGMGVTLPGSAYTEVRHEPFYGVYYGQAALPMAADSLVYLTSDILAGCTVTNYETNKVGGIYDTDKLHGSDPYEVYLSGPISLMTVENPAAATDRELVIFRDSFGSSVVPLLVPGYAKITLVDIRYIASDFVGSIVDLTGADDVLFLYSTLVLNNSVTMK